jgi:hypothetical protein
MLQKGHKYKVTKTKEKGYRPRSMRIIKQSEAPELRKEESGIRNQDSGSKKVKWRLRYGEGVGVVSSFGDVGAEFFGDEGLGKSQMLVRRPARSVATGARAKDMLATNQTCKE